jgi:hypothetical protein
MRKLLLAILFALAPITACTAAEDLDPVILLELAAAKRVREASTKTTPAVPAPAAKKLCGCGLTGTCECLESNCGCSACGRGAAPETKKLQGGQSSQGSLTGQRTAITDAPIAGKNPQPVPGAGSFEGTQAPNTITAVPTPIVRLTGSTSPCASGNCPAQRTGLFGRKK